MRFFCPACGTGHSMDDNNIPAGGTQVECTKCGFAIKIKAPVRPQDSATEPEMPEADALIEPRPAADATGAATDVMPAAGAAAEPPAPEATAAGAEPPAPEATAAGAEPPAPEATAAKGADEPVRPSKPSKPEKAGGGGWRLPYAGCGRSGERFRFRDLFYALQAPLDIRKLLAAAAGVFVGGALLILVGWLAMLTESRVAVTIGLIVGFVLYFACSYLGLGIATAQTDREMRHGGRLPIGEGIGFVKQRLATVVGFPFLFVLAMVGLAAGIAAFHLMARIPYAGPILYGLFYAVVFGLGLLVVLVGVLMFFSTFSYIPAAGDRGLLALARHLWAKLRRHPGPFALHLLAATAVSGLLLWLLTWLVGSAMGVITRVDGLVGGGEYSQILLSMPGSLFPLWTLLYDTGLQPGAGAGWQFTIGGWLVFIALMGVFALVLGFVLTYFHAAGVVNYHLLAQREAEQDGGGEPAAPA
jgi:predicted Zn finger-like uncharacterized protein